MSEPKLCPFRTARVYRVLLAVGVNPAAHEIPQDEFFPCLQDKCAMWREEKELIRRAYVVVHPDKPDERFPATYKKTGYCGLAGRP